MAACIWVERKLNKPIERKTCGEVLLDSQNAAKQPAAAKGGAEQ